MDPSGPPQPHVEPVASTPLVFGGPFRPASAARGARRVHATCAAGGGAYAAGMHRTRWQALGALLVCALLALASAGPRGATGWFESAVEIAYTVTSASTTAAAEQGESAAPLPGIDDRASCSGVRARVRVPAAPAWRTAFAGLSGLPTFRARPRDGASHSPLYLLNSALLC